MPTPPEIPDKINRKLNALLLLVGILFISALSTQILQGILNGRPLAGGPSLASWDAGRPFGDDLDGSREQRNVVDKAKAANGQDAAKIHLHVLNLTGLSLSEDEFITIGTMTEIRELNLKKTNLQDKNLLSLVNLGKLEVLDLSETQLTDNSLPLLRKFRHLRSLDLTGTRVSARGVRSLYEQMPQLRAHLYGDEANHFGSSIQATMGKIVLLKYGFDHIAFKFTEDTNSGDGGSKYVWYWQPVTGSKFQAETLKTGQAEVFEKYRKSKRIDRQTTLIEDDGGQLEMRMGPAKLRWSKPRSVYYPSEYESAPPVVFAFTTWDRVDQINFDDESLKWYEKTGR